MRAAVMHGPGDVRMEDRDDPRVQLGTDAVVRVVAACVCGSDLWPYRGFRDPAYPLPMGHEFIGVVEAIGGEVRTITEGDFVIAPFADSDGTCVHCRNNIQTSCVNGGYFAGTDRHGSQLDGGQAEYVRVPWADGTLVRVPEAPSTETEIADLLTLSDVMATGLHAATSAGVGPGRTVVVVGDGAVGLCGVLAARELGAERIIAMSRHSKRQELATHFGATDIVEQRGREGTDRVKELLGGVGADSVLECVGSKQSMSQALHSLRPGGQLGYVGVPADGPELSIGMMFGSNLNVAGGVAPARAYIPRLLTDVLAGRIDPGKVFDLTLPLEQTPAGYAAMDERTAVKVMLRP